MAYTPIYTTAAAVRQEAGFYGNANIVDATHIEPPLFEAEGEVTAAVGQRYTLPLSANTAYANSPGQQLVIGIARQLAAGKLLYGQFKGQGGSMVDKAVRMLGEARGRLKMLERGDLRLYGTDNAELATRSSGGAGLSGYPTNTTAEDDPDSGAKYTSNMTF